MASDEDDDVFARADTAIRAAIEASRALPRESVSLGKRLAKMHARGDIWGALMLAMRSTDHPEDSVDAANYLQRQQAALLDVCEWRLGRFDDVPRLLVEKSQLTRLPLDARSAYLVFMIDGMHSYEDLMAIVSLPRLECAFTFAFLKQTGVIVS